MSEMQGILSGMYKVPFPPPPPFGEENQVGKKGKGRPKLKEKISSGEDGKGKGEPELKTKGKRKEGKDRKEKGEGREEKGRDDSTEKIAK